MHIKRIHDMIEKVTECANGQLTKGTDCVDTEEMEKVACIIKDLSEAEYYSKITKAMEDYEEDSNRYYEDGNRYYDNYRYKRSGRFAPKGKGSYMPRHYDEPMYHMTPDMYREHDASYYRDMDRDSRNVMYYTESNNKGNESSYERTKRMYTETKNSRRTNSVEDKQAKLKDLEEYARELTNDVMSMINDMSAEEKNLLKTKLQLLVQKFV